MLNSQDCNTHRFLSTLSLRRATSADCNCHSGRRYFYPRSPYGERLSKTIPRGGHIRFLSTLSLRRATSAETARTSNADIFLSTLSLRRATRTGQSAWIPSYYFYPRSPYGERPGKVKLVEPGLVFLSTLSLRRATAKVHKTVEHFCAYETNFMGIASSC